MYLLRRQVGKISQMRKEFRDFCHKLFVILRQQHSFWYLSISSSPFLNLYSWWESTYSFKYLQVVLFLNICRIINSLGVYGEPVSGRLYSRFWGCSGEGNSCWVGACFLMQSVENFTQWWVHLLLRFEVASTSSLP